MVKHIIQIADLHIPNEYIHKGRPYKEMFKSFLAQLYKFIKQNEYQPEETRIVICGDIFHNKIKISNEALDMFHEVLNYLDAMCLTYVFAGNHDLLENNHNRIDSLTPTFSIKDVYKNVVYLDKELGYKSGYYEDDNVLWVLYSIHDKYDIANVDSLSERFPEHQIIGLYHGNVVGAVTDIGYQIDKGIDTTMFKGCKCVMAGHIHKYQVVRKDGVPIVYASSLFQQDGGENISGHGFLDWDMETLTHTFHEVESKHRILRFEVFDYDDVDNNDEKLINL